MPLIQLLLTAASLVAAAGGLWDVEKTMDRYGRIPAPEVEEALVEAAGEDEEDPRLLY